MSIKKNLQATKGGTDGQRLAKIDRADDVVGVESVPLRIKEVVRRERDARGWTQQKLAEECKKALPLIRDLENVNAKTQPQQDVLTAVENALNVKLRGKDIGAPKNLKRKEREDRERAEREERERAAQAELEERLAKKKAEEEGGEAEDEAGEMLVDDAGAEGVQEGEDQHE